MHEKEDDEFVLSIKYVKQEDAGTYECQVRGGDDVTEGVSILYYFLVFRRPLTNYRWGLLFSAVSFF